MNEYSRPLVVPVNFPDPPEVGDPDDALEVSIQELRHWQNAPSNPLELSRAGVSFDLAEPGKQSFNGLAVLIVHSHEAPLLAACRT